MRAAKWIARKLCKACESVEEGEVSFEQTIDFHKLINTCVENLIAPKYFLRNSALALLRDGFAPAK